jgi:hypothetical protein
MNSVSREEVDAKIAALDARIEGYIASIRATIDGLVMRMDERDKRADERDKRIDERIARIERSFEKTEAAISDLKKTTIVTGISAVIAIVLGVGAINAALLFNMIAAFQAGGNMAATQAEVRRQVEETAVLLKQIQAAQAKPAEQAMPNPHRP